MKKIVSIHIPKCAGGSLNRALRIAFGHRMRNDYGDGVLRIDLKAVEKRRRRKRQMLENIQLMDSISIIHGHFYASKYIDAPFPKEWITFVRHPAELLFSYYHYARGRDKGPGRPLVNLGWELSFEEFLESPQFSNIITRVTHPLEPEDFSFIGFQRVYRQSLSALSARLGIELREVFQNRYSKSDVPLQVEYNDHLLKLVKKFNALDLDWYERAKAHVRALSLPSPQGGN